MSQLSVRGQRTARVPPSGMRVRKRVQGRSRPAPVLRTLRVVVGPFNPVARRLLTMGTILATEDHSFDMGPTLSEFPMELTRYEDCIAKWHEERQ